MDNDQISKDTELLERILEAESRQTKIARIRLAISSVGVLLAVIILIVLCSAANSVRVSISNALDTYHETADSIHTLTDQLSSIDFSTLADSYQMLADAGTNTLKEIKSQAEGIGDLTENAEKTMQDAAEALSMLKSVNIESLNNGIERLNEILTPLSNFLSVFNR